MNHLFGYLHAGILSHWTGAIWLEQTFRTQPWNMVSPLLPVVLLFSLFYKSQNFWNLHLNVWSLDFLFIMSLFSFSQEYWG